jgi:hypothetical protein
VLHRALAALAGKRRMQNDSDTAIFSTASSIAGLPAALPAARRDGHASGRGKAAQCTQQGPRVAISKAREAERV